MGADVARTRNEAVRRVSPACEARIPRYVRALQRIEPAQPRGTTDATSGPGLPVTTISSSALAEAAGVSAAVLRKDLASLQIPGKRGVGYVVPDLLRMLTETTQRHGVTDVVVLGSPALIGAVAMCPAFNDESMVLSESVELADGQITPEVRDRLAGAVARQPALTVVLAVGVDRVDEIVLALVGVGVRSIYSLTPVTVDVPGNVRIRTLDLAAEVTLTGWHEPGANRDESSAAATTSAVA
jgi:redox-sensing transcriptional repressor